MTLPTTPGDMIGYSIRYLILLILVGIPVESHSWVEEAVVVDEHGQRIGPLGYARCNVFRIPGVDVDQEMTYKLPQAPKSQVTSTDNICSDRQAQLVTALALQAAPGDVVSLRYQENGHIALPEASPGKPDSGVVFVYGTWHPVPSAKFRDIHRVWGTLEPGSNEEEFLLTRSAFDDGQCYQVNEGQISRLRQATFPHESSPPEGENKWCATNFTVPRWHTCRSASGAPSSILTVYWIWDWPGSPGNSSAEQYYTTCLDVIVSG
ncbi:uncharacterized protein HMPREF1541_10433 [Cyphellophora europaea CBS 101466]|uniref:DUF7492 domain-containing protein n=1 Tax=Cyphellophora europaea (strain CBS 101466) TaxID=1220924 RepID=W2S9P8_CYPE1|nr:uncharacterized protein HMPREF1541_10433 [Cyphellophora europaea CBS 101466]ETN44763.1 hypothetical protein HMPREF1541_10433 [Cyphellophora europaea CBS 101466]